MVEHKNPFDTLEREAESSDTSGVAISAPAAVCADFQLGPSSGGRVSGISNAKKNQRK